MEPVLMRALATLLLVAMLGCAPSDGLVVVVVQSNDFYVQKLSQSLHVLASAGTREASLVFTLHSPGLFSPESFALQTPASYRGTVSFNVTAADDTGRWLAAATGSSEARPSKTEYLTLPLITLAGVGSDIDAGVGADGGGSDGGSGNLGPGERCDDSRRCVAGLICGGYFADPHYCLYPCLSVGDCPVQTQCMPAPHVFGVGGNACMYVSMSDASARQPGESCVQTSDHCVGGYICGGATCDAQCDGPSGKCAAGTCKQLLALPMAPPIIAYICQP